jgi:hypothetical protein
LPRAAETRSTRPRSGSGGLGSLDDLGRATDELVERFAKRTDAALKRLRDQGVGKGF